MSWEKISEKKISCPCNKGLIFLFNEMDDWNRLREDVFIDCQSCSKKYIIERVVNSSHPFHEHTIYYLVNKGTNNKKILDL